VVRADVGEKDEGFASLPMPLRVLVPDLTIIEHRVNAGLVPRFTGNFCRLTPQFSNK